MIKFNLTVSELDKGRRKGSIVILEGKQGSGWKSFGVQLRKTILPQIQNNGAKHRSATLRPVRMTEKFRQAPRGLGKKGKESALSFQNLKSCISWGGISRTDKHHVGAEVTSVKSAINEAENPSVNTSLSLDISLRVEHGNVAKWVVISSEIKEVDPVAVKPIGVNKPHSFKIVLLNGSGPRSFATWKPKAHDGSLKTLGYKSGSQHFNSKIVPSVT